MRDSFSKERLSRLGAIEGWHFWFAGRRVLLERLLAAAGVRVTDTVLDLGCGTGSTVRLMRARGHRVVGLDLRTEGLTSLRRGCSGCEVVQADATRIPFAPASFDVVLALDVVEHVDDGALLAEVSRVLRPGGVLIAAVPALPWLWSYRDMAAGHLRRYTRAQLRQALEAADIRVRDIRYYQFFLFPLLAAARVFGRKSARMRDAEERPVQFFNTILAAVNRTEARLGDLVAWPWGSSLAVVGRKD